MMVIYDENNRRHGAKWSWKEKKKRTVKKVSHENKVKCGNVANICLFMFLDFGLDGKTFSELNIRTFQEET